MRSGCREGMPCEASSRPNCVWDVGVPHSCLGIRRVCLVRLHPGQTVCGTLGSHTRV